MSLNQHLVNVLAHDRDSAAGEGSVAGRDPDDLSESANKVVAIEAVTIADYSHGADPGEDALKQFANQNASFHVWPYWREFVANQCLRMNLPKIVLPTRQFCRHPE